MCHPAVKLYLRAFISAATSRIPDWSWNDQRNIRKVWLRCSSFDAVCRAAGVAIKWILWTGNNRRAAASGSSREQQEMIMKTWHMVASLQNTDRDSFLADTSRQNLGTAEASSHKTSCPCVYCYEASKSAARRLCRMFEGGGEKVHHHDDEALQTKKKK